MEESSKTSKYQILSEIVGFLKFVGDLQQPVWKRSQKNNFALHFTSYLSNALSTKSCPIQKQITLTNFRYLVKTTLAVYLSNFLKTHIF